MPNCDFGGVRRFLFCSTLTPTAPYPTRLLDLIFRCRAGARRRAGLEERPGHEVQPYTGVRPAAEITAPRAHLCRYSTGNIFLQLQ